MLNRKPGQRGKSIDNKVCSKCDSKFSWRNRWLRIDTGPACYKCYQKATHNIRKKYRYDENGKIKRRPCEITPAYRFKSGIRAAKETNREWNLTLEQWNTIIAKGCYYCSESLFETGGYSLDRISNDLGYSIENVLPCCGFCNGFKSNKLSVEETKYLIS